MAQERFQTLFALDTNVRGAWFPIMQNNVPFSLTFEGISASTLQVRVSNKPYPGPGTSDDEIQYGADVTADGKVEVTAPFGWIMIKKTAGAVAVTVRMFAQSMLG